MAKRFLQVALAALLLVLGASGAVSAPAPPRPDLRVSVLSAPASPVVVGGSLSTAARTKNRGNRRAKRSRTRLYLSRDAKKSRDDKRIASIVVKALGPGKSSRKRINPKLPSSVPPATGYRLLACADDTKKVRERRERNNCRAAKGKLTVASSVPGGTGGGGASAADSDGDGSPDAADCAPNDPSVSPGATDKPDVPAFKDTNCDAIDGDEARAIFVSPTGNDANPGTRAQPKRTVDNAIGAAAGSSPVKDVYLAGGNYDRADLTDDVGLYGGYSAGDWSRSLATVTNLSGSVFGARAAGDTGVVLQHLTVTAQALADNSTYGVIAFNSSLTLERVALSADPGPDGSSVLSPFPDTAPAGENGQPGDAGVEHGGGGFPCGSGHAFGGPGGSSSVGRAGGRGGHGGADEGDGNLTGGGGVDGSGAAGGGPGTPGEAGNWNTPSFYWGENGAPGADGPNGAAGSQIYQGIGYTPAAGDGTNGAHGHGGSGGGGGGGGTSGCDSTGGGGGGGGAGGHRGAGGGGGGSGQGSFGLYAWASTISITDSTIQAANGGAGGAGGIGQLGGAGGAPGFCAADGPTTGKGNCYGGSGQQDDGSNGGRGGFGGRGGDGGNGGGGAGGPSVAILSGGGSTVDPGNSSLSHGSGGAGGAGGGGSPNGGPGGPAQQILTVP